MKVKLIAVALTSICLTAAMASATAQQSPSRLPSSDSDQDPAIRRPINDHPGDILQPAGPEAPLSAQRNGD